MCSYKLVKNMKESSCDFGDREHGTVIIFQSYSAGGNPSNLFFFVNEEFFHFLLLSLAVVLCTHLFCMLQALKLNSKNWKTGKMIV